MPRDVGFSTKTRRPSTLSRCLGLEASSVLHLTSAVVGFESLVVVRLIADTLYHVARDGCTMSR